MSNELGASYLPANTVYFLLRNSTGSIYNGATFEAYLTANYATYVILATQQGTASGFYTVNMPAVAAGVYEIVAKSQSGGSPAEADIGVGEGQIQWNGTAETMIFGDVKLAATGLDNISAADPGGVATTFAQMLVALWRRFFKKVTLTATELKTFADNGTTVRTTQAVSSDTVTQTQGPAT